MHGAQMTYSRIYGILDLELSQHLTFSFSIDENLTTPGRLMVHAGDQFRFFVWVTNNSAIPLRDLEGVVTHSSLAKFPETGFSVDRLAPGKRKKIATIEGQIVRLPRRSIVRFNQIGLVHVEVQPDLSRYRLEKSRPLTFLQIA